MTSEITLLLQQGWANLWKNKILWVFSSLVLIDPLIRLWVPIPKYDDLPSALSYLALTLVFAYLSVLSYVGILFVAYCIAIGKPVGIKTAFQSSTNIFWRVVGAIFLLFIIVSPCWLTAYIVSYKQPFQLADLAHSFFFLTILLSIFVALFYFPTTEIIANDFKDRQKFESSLDRIHLQILNSGNCRLGACNSVLYDQYYYQHGCNACTEQF